MRCVSIDKLEECAKKFNCNDFFVTINRDDNANYDNYYGSPQFIVEGEMKDIHEKCKLKNTIIIGKYDFSNHFNDSYTLIKVKAGQYSFFPLYDDKTYQQLFYTSGFSFTFCALAIVSHSLKQLSYAIAYETDDNNIMILGYNNEITHNFLVNNRLKLPLFYPNVAFSKYKNLFNTKYDIDGLFLTLDDYFAYQIELEKLKCHNMLVSIKKDIIKSKAEINKLNENIAYCNDQKEKVKQRFVDFKTNIFKAKVDAELMGA